MSVGDSALLMFYTQSIERQGSGGQTWTHMSSVTGPLVAGFVRKQEIQAGAGHVEKFVQNGATC